MSVFLTIIAVIVIFSLLVLIHEYGHFVAARRAGIKVLEFGIGFPPRLFKKKVGETLYTVNAIPFGGFVKLFGEDSSDPDALKDKRSFASQTAWVRTKVIVAGVFMNFVLAIALLTIGFSFGIEPLLVTEDDLFHHLAQGNVASAPGAFVSKVSNEAVAAELEKGDQIVAINDVPITQVGQISVFMKGKATKDSDITVRGKDGKEKKLHVPVDTKANSLGIDLKPFTEFPRLSILEVKQDSSSSRAGLKSGDVILQMNGEEVYFPADFENILTESSEITFTVLRGTSVLPVSVKMPDSRRVVIAEVYEDTAAKEYGFIKGDVVVSMDGVAVSSPEQVQKILRDNPGKLMRYKILRDSTQREVQAKSGANNFLGVALSSIASFRNTEVSVYRGSLLTSITEIKKVRYAPWAAFKQAISESVRLTGLTIKAFGKTIGSIISKFAVPGEIGGPVQIAYYTHTFVQEGFFALLRFTALLSLSLAVMNVLPIPALDGGRLLFVIIEIVSGRRVNAKFEAIVHSIGFALLLLLIVLVTYSDITKLF